MRSLAPLVLVAALASLGCVSAATTSPPEIDALVRRAHVEGIELADPLALDDAITRELDAEIGSSEPDEERLFHVVRLLDKRGFTYAPNTSLGARDAWYARRGDCMAFAALFVALTRHAGVPTYFVHVTEVRKYYEAGGSFFVSSHVAVGFGSGPSAIVVDLFKQASRWQLATFDGIGDRSAFALFHSNGAVRAMLDGRLDEAERTFRFLLRQEPEVAEPYNNLGVLLSRRHRHAEALRVLEAGLVRFPIYEPLLTNAVQAARSAGDLAAAARLERRADALATNDPYYLFARALAAYQREAYDEAARELERAADAKPESAVIHAWLTRAYWSSGRRGDAARALERARAIDGSADVVRELERQLPGIAPR